MYSEIYEEDARREIIPRAKHTHPGDALFSILEQLYEGSGYLNQERLVSDFAYLCDYLEVDTDILSDPYNKTRLQEAIPPKKTSFYDLAVSLTRAQVI